MASCFYGVKPWHRAEATGPPKEKPRLLGAGRRRTGKGPSDENGAPSMTQPSRDGKGRAA
jgi:hypothetical protein